MITIQIDEDVYRFLQNEAKPFIENEPNAVLRRLLLGKEEQKMKTQELQSTGADANEFVKLVLDTDFHNESFMKKKGYRMMFESDNYIVYFQNFNQQGANNLWYRLNERPQEVLRSTKKETYVYFTNPAESYAFAIPFSDIDDHLEQDGKSKEAHIEVNIYDIPEAKWHELDWNLRAYYKEYN